MKCFILFCKKKLLFLRTVKTMSAGTEHYLRTRPWPSWELCHIWYLLSFFFLFLKSLSYLCWSSLYQHPHFKIWAQSSRGKNKKISKLWIAKQPQKLVYNGTWSTIQKLAPKWRQPPSWCVQQTPGTEQEAPIHCASSEHVRFPLPGHSAPVCWHSISLNCVHIWKPLLSKTSRYRLKSLVYFFF